MVGARPGPCGRYVAVIVNQLQCKPGLEASNSDSDSSEEFDEDASISSADWQRMSTFEVHVYSVCADFARRAIFCTQLREPVIQWSPASCLCIAQMLAVADRLHFVLDRNLGTDMTVWPAAFRYEPCLTTDETFNLNSEASGQLSCMGMGCQVHPCWSPSGQYLAVHGAPLSRHNRETAPGWLAIADVWRGSLIAEAKLKSSFKSFREERLSIVWHPSSRALIVQGDIEIQDTAAITRAGFGIGQLPAGFRMHQAGFSGDASFLMTEYHDPSDERTYYDLYYLTCKLQGLQVCLGQPQNQALPEFDAEVCGMCWMPSSNTVFLEFDGIGSPMQILLSECGSKEAYAPRTTLSISDRVCSSGRFYMTGPCIEGELCRSIAEVQGGQVILTPSTSDLGWAAIHEQPGGSVSQGSPHSLVCHAWAPTGVGPICSSHGIDISGRGYLPPALHFYRYA